MESVTKTIDVKKLAGVLHACPAEPAQPSDPDAMGPEDLNPSLTNAYLQALREERIKLADIDFNNIGEGDIDDLETALSCSPATKLFSICEKFRMLKPSAAAWRVFI